MTKMMAVLIFVAFSMVGTTTVASADIEKGQKIFKKKFRKYCGFSGVKFARMHTQDEWEELYDNKKFPEEAKKICPRLKLNTIKAEWWEDVYEFTYEYGIG